MVGFGQGYYTLAVSQEDGLNRGSVRRMTDDSYLKAKANFFAGVLVIIAALIAVGLFYLFGGWYPILLSFLFILAGFGVVLYKMVDWEAQND